MESYECGHTIAVDAYAVAQYPYESGAVCLHGKHLQI